MIKLAAAPSPIEVFACIYRYGHASTLLFYSANEPVLAEAVSSDSTSRRPGAQTNQIADLANQGVSNKRELTNLDQAVNDHIHESNADLCSLQGGWVEALSHMDQDVSWKACISGLSEATYSFLVRSIVDALPTNSNLFRWKKILSSTCGSCSGSKQTLLHVLNNCESKLDLYTWRHNNILFRMKNFFNSNLENCEILCDLCVQDSTFINGRVNTIPIDIVQTNLRPDLVIIDRENKSATICELTVPFESNIARAHERKSEKYAPLIAAFEENDFNCKFYSFAIGSRGVAAQGTCSSVREICKVSRKGAREFVKEFCQCVAKCSYIIFREKDNANVKFSTLM